MTLTDGNREDTVFVGDGGATNSGRVKFGATGAGGEKFEADIGGGNNGVSGRVGQAALERKKTTGTDRIVGSSVGKVLAGTEVDLGIKAVGQGRKKDKKEGADEIWGETAGEEVSF